MEAYNRFKTILNITAGMNVLIYGSLALFGAIQGETMVANLFFAGIFVVFTVAFHLRSFVGAVAAFALGGVAIFVLTSAHPLVVGVYFAVAAYYLSRTRTLLREVAAAG